MGNMHNSGLFKVGDSHYFLHSEGLIESLQIITRIENLQTID